MALVEATEDRTVLVECPTEGCTTKMQLPLIRSTHQIGGELYLRVRPDHTELDRHIEREHPGMIA